MPTLPSGLAVAVDPAPLRKLLLDFDSPFNAHHLMALQSVDDLLRWLEVLILKPADSLTAAEGANSQPAPDGAPTGIRAVPVGVRLADWRSVASTWTDDDRSAFAAFIEETILPAMAGPMANARMRQEALLKTPTFAGAFACMWRDGATRCKSKAGTMTEECQLCRLTRATCVQRGPRNGNRAATIQRSRRFDYR